MIRRRVRGQTNSSAPIVAKYVLALIVVAGVLTITACDYGANGCGVGGTCNVLTPTITSLSPSSTVAGGPNFTLTVNGTDFNTYSDVYWNGAKRNTTFVSASQLSALIGALDITASATVPVTVVNSSPHSNTTATSLPANFIIDPAGGNPVPTITSLSPTTTLAAEPQGFTLEVAGTGFVGKSVVNWNGNPRSTSVISQTQLSVSISVSDIANAGTATITVTNPTPGGGTSNSVSFTIAALQITSSSALPPGTVNLSYNQLLAVNIAPATQTWSVVSGTLPPGLTFAGGIFNGSPVQSGTFNFTIQVVGDSTTQIASKAFSLTINAAAPPGFVGIISENNAGGAAATAPNFIIALSSDARYAAFENGGAQNSQLVSNPAPSQAYDIFWNDSCLGTSDCSLLTQLASVIDGDDPNGGHDGNGPSIGNSARSGVSISGDGRWVAFPSNATNLNPEGYFPPLTTNYEEVYLRDNCTAAVAQCTPHTYLASVTDQDREPNGPAIDGSISATYGPDTIDGEAVAFISYGTNVVSGLNVTVTPQVYVDLVHRADPCPQPVCIFMASVDSNGNPANQPVSGIAVSAHGQFVIFATAASNLGAPNQFAQVFRRDTTCPAVSYGCQIITTMVSVDNNGNAAVQNGAFIAGISDDGRFLAFYSIDQLAPNSSPDVYNLYVRDTCFGESGAVTNCTPSTTTVSVAADGSASNGSVGFVNNPHILSADGRFIVFSSSATNLAPGGAPAGGVYVRDTCNEVPSGCTPTTVLVSLDSNGNFEAGSYPVISADGHYCAYMENSSGWAVLARTGF